MKQLKLWSEYTHGTELFFFLATHLATADLGLEPQSTLSHFRSCKMDLTSNNSKEFPRGHIAEKVKMPVTVVVLKY